MNHAAEAFAILGGAIFLVLAWLQYPPGRTPPVSRVLAAAGMLVVGFLPYDLVILAVFGPGLDFTTVPEALYTAYVRAALPEELFKGVVVWLVLLRRRPVRRVQDGVFFGIVVGLSFAFVENLEYIAMARSEAFAEDADQIAFVRVFMAAPSHAIYTALVAHRLVLARLAAPALKARHLAWGLGGAILLHGTYDAVLMAGEVLEAGWAMPAGIAIVMATVVVGWLCLDGAKRIDRALEAQKSPSSSGKSRERPRSVSRRPNP